MKCGNEGQPECVYAMFSPVDRCLAPYADNDPKRGIAIGPDTECISPKWYLKTDFGKRRNQIELYKIVLEQKGKDERPNRSSQQAS